MKKTLMILLALSLLCILAVGSTMSYLTYTDYDVNTMVIGNVKIEQIEQQRGESGLEAFEDDKPLYPITGTMDSLVNINGQDYSMIANSLNAVDKIVTVKNIGSESAYVRTVFAFEMKETNIDGSTTWVSPLDIDLTLRFNLDSQYGSLSVTDVQFDKDGTQYVVCIYTYHNALAKDEISAPSLLQIYLNSTVGNEFYESVGSNYDILVLSQAAQTAGFDSAAEALNAAFGEVSEESAMEWFANAKEGTA